MAIGAHIVQLGVPLPTEVEAVMKIARQVHSVLNCLLVCGYVFAAAIVPVAVASDYWPTDGWVTPPGFPRTGMNRSLGMSTSRPATFLPARKSRMTGSTF